MDTRLPGDIILKIVGYMARGDIPRLMRANKAMAEFLDGHLLRVVSPQVVGELPAIDSAVHARHTRYQDDFAGYIPSVRVLNLQCCGNPDGYLQMTGLDVVTRKNNLDAALSICRLEPIEELYLDRDDYVIFPTAAAYLVNSLKVVEVHVGSRRIELVLAALNVLPHLEALTISASADESFAGMVLSLPALRRLNVTFNQRGPGQNGGLSRSVLHPRSLFSSLEHVRIDAGYSLLSADGDFGDMADGDSEYLRSIATFVTRLGTARTLKYIAVRAPATFFNNQDLVMNAEEVASHGPTPRDFVHRLPEHVGIVWIGANNNTGYATLNDLVIWSAQHPHLEHVNISTSFSKFTPIPNGLVNKLIKVGITHKVHPSWWEVQIDAASP